MHVRRSHESESTWRRRPILIQYFYISRYLSAAGSHTCLNSFAKYVGGSTWAFEQINDETRRDDDDNDDDDRWGRAKRREERRSIIADSQVARTDGIDLCNVVVAQSLFAVGYRSPSRSAVCYCWAARWRTGSNKPRVRCRTRACLLARSRMIPTGKENIAGEGWRRKKYFLSLPRPPGLWSAVTASNATATSWKRRERARGFDIPLARPDKHEMRRYRNARVECA